MEKTKSKKTFRLSEEAIENLYRLSNGSGKSQTEVVEELLMNGQVISKDKELKELRKDIAFLRNDMHKYFGAIDSSLNLYAQAVKEQKVAIENNLCRLASDDKQKILHYIDENYQMQMSNYIGMRQVMNASVNTLKEATTLVINIIIHTGRHKYVSL